MTRAITQSLPFRCWIPLLVCTGSMLLAEAAATIDAVDTVIQRSTQGEIQIVVSDAPTTSGIDFVLHIESSVADPLTPNPVVAAGYAIDGWDIAVNVIEGGGGGTIDEIRISAASSTPIAKGFSGTLLGISLNAQSFFVPTQTDLIFILADLNETAVLGPVDGTVSIGGFDGTLSLLPGSVPLIPGSVNIDVSVTDLDLSGDGSIDLVVTNSTTGEFEIVTLLEGPAGTFTFSLPTVFDNTAPFDDDNGALGIQAGDQITTLYTDILDANGQTTPVPPGGGGDLTVPGNDGTVDTDPDQINAGADVDVTVSDADLKTAGTLDVSVENTGSGEVQTLTLNENPADSGNFEGTVTTIFGAAPIAGKLAVQGGDSVQASYLDVFRADGSTTTLLASTLVLSGTQDGTVETLEGQIKPGEVVTVRVSDSDLAGSADVTVRLTDAAAAVKETQVVNLPETGAGTGVFEGTVTTIFGAAPIAGKLAVIPGDKIDALYFDALKVDGDTTTVVSAPPTTVSAGFTAILTVSAGVQPGDSLRIELEDQDLNTAGTDNVDVEVKNLNNNDIETVTLTETTPASGIFRFAPPFPTNDLSGISLASGDFNRDGFDDIAIGASIADPPGTTNGGKVYLIFGGGLGASVNLSNPADVDVTIIGAADNDQVGYWLTTLDFNGDDLEDLLVGGPYGDAPGGSAAGKAYLIEGDPYETLPATINLAAPSSGLTVLGDDADDNLGISLGGGDLNGDFVGDLILSAFLADQLAGADAGEAYVVFGAAPSTAMSIADTQATYGENLLVEVDIDATTGLKIVEFDLHIAFDSDLLTWDAVYGTGTMTDGWTFSSAVSPGAASTMDTVKINGTTWIDATTNNGAASVVGTLFHAGFVVADIRHPANSPLELTYLLFNGGRTEWTQETDGSVVLIGNDAVLDMTVVSMPGDTVRVRLTDPDFNTNPGVIETATAELRNPVTSELEDVQLVEISAGNSVFFGTVLTVFGAAGTAQDGEFHTSDGDSLFATLVDTLSSAGVTVNRNDSSFVVNPFGDVDANGSAQAFDAARILAHSVKLITFDEHDSLAANVDLAAPFGPVDSFDAALVIQHRLRRIKRFPVQEDEAANHPQPETDNSVPKILARDTRHLTLVRQAKHVAIHVDNRQGIWAGDLFVAGIDAEAVVAAPEIDGSLVEYRVDASGVHIAFAMEQSVSGAGELLRILTAADDAGNSVAPGPVEGRLNGGGITVVSIAAEMGSESDALPKRTRLHENFPNPFNAETQIGFDLAHPGEVRLRIVNSLGQHVNTMVDDRLAAGTYRIVWNGTDAAGKAVASGTYLSILQTSEFEQVRSLTLLK